MPSLTFPCPACGRRMGVALDAAGRPVRCPHCHHVAPAPAAAGADPLPSPGPAPVPPPAPVGPLALSAPAPVTPPVAIATPVPAASPVVRVVPWREAVIVALALYGAGMTVVAARGCAGPPPPASRAE